MSNVQLIIKNKNNILLRAKDEKMNILNLGIVKNIGFRMRW